MKFGTPAAVFLGLALTLSTLSAAGCGRPDSHKSIKVMKKGVEMFNVGQLTGAQKKFEEAIQISRDNHVAYFNLGQTLDARKNYEDAVEAYEEAVKLRGDDAMYQYRLGKALYMSGKNDKAQKHLEKALSINDKLYKAHYFLGKVYLAQDKVKEAATSWTKSAEANPLFGKPFNALGILYITWDKLPEAVRVLENGAINARGEQDLSNIYYHLGFAFEKQNNLAKAIENYTKSIEAKNNTDALRQRGVSYAAQGDIKKATADLEKFVKVASDPFNKQTANSVLMKLHMKN